VNAIEAFFFDSGIGEKIEEVSSMFRTSKGFPHKYTNTGFIFSIGEFESKVIYPFKNI
jgi:hypothetical protein